MQNAKKKIKGKYFVTEAKGEIEREQTNFTATKGKVTRNIPHNWRKKNFKRTCGQVNCPPKDNRIIFPLKKVVKDDKIK